jgi:hypothetical protein
VKLADDKVTIALAAPGRARTIVLIEPPHFEPGPAAGVKFDRRLSEDADDLWDTLRGGLPIETLRILRENFRAWRP